MARCKGGRVWERVKMDEVSGEVRARAWDFYSSRPNARVPMKSNVKALYAGTANATVILVIGN